MKLWVTFITFLRSAHHIDRSLNAHTYTLACAHTHVCTDVVGNVVKKDDEVP